MRDFFRQFLLPLVKGGAVHVGAPLGQRGMERLRDASLEPSIDAELIAARSRVAAELLLEPAPPIWDEESLRLAVATHDLLFLLHPRAQTLRAAQREQIALCTCELARLPDSLDADELVARHTLLHLLPTLARTDVTVEFWAGRREFVGTAPPHRLVAWPELRRVRQEQRSSDCFAEAAGDSVAAPALRALLDASPLTDLFSLLRREPLFDLGHHVPLLRDPRLCRLVAYRYLELDASRMGDALTRAVIAQLPNDELRPSLCAFFAHLHLCQLLAGRSSIDLSVRTSLRDFHALFAALFRTVPDWCAPPDVLHDPTLAMQLHKYSEACLQSAGSGRVAELTGLLRPGVESTAQR